MSISYSHLKMSQHGKRVLIERHEASDKMTLSSWGVEIFFSDIFSPIFLLSFLQFSYYWILFMIVYWTSNCNLNLRSISLVMNTKIWKSDYSQITLSFLVGCLFSMLNGAFFCCLAFVKWLLRSVNFFWWSENKIYFYCLLLSIWIFGNTWANDKSFLIRFDFVLKEFISNA